MQHIRKNAKENVWIEGYDDHTAGTVTVASATFQVFDADDASVQASASATIADNTTTTPDVYGLVDTSVAAFVNGSAYKVEFVVTIGSEVYREVVPIKCVEDRL